MLTNARTTLSESQYNGLSWRIVHRSDADGNPATGTNGAEHERVMYYDANWRLLEERINPNAAAAGDDRVAQHVWGFRHLDDLVLRRWRRAANAWPGPTPQGANGGTWWACTDAQFSVVALLDSGGKVVERARYDAYGNASHHSGTDVDGDRDTDSGDAKAISTLLASWIGGGPLTITAGQYRAEYDLDRDGDIDGNDTLAVGPAVTAQPLGQVSAGGGSGPDGLVGYGGYVFNRESLLYTVRYRHYSPALGRWLERDPLGYIDGSNLLEYCAGSPLVWLDPMGLSFWDWFTGGASSKAIQDAQDKNCAELRRQFCEGKMTAAQYASVAAGCGGSVAAAIAAAGMDALVDGIIEGATDPHTILDGLGMVPGVGIVADVANGLLYAAQGKYGMAGLSMIAAIPFIGDAVGAAKIAARAGGRLGDVVIAAGDVGNDIRRASEVRTISKGETVSDLQHELIARTWASGGLEHAVISLNDGRRVIVSGGVDGIRLPSDTRRVIGHTHPKTTGPSDHDFDMLNRLGQGHSYIYELGGGGRTRFNRR